jgi:hypothetical protein
MNEEEIPRKDLDDQQFMQLRQVTEKIVGALEKRLKEHLDILRPLFIPKKLFGTYIKSATMEEVPGSDKAFTELQEQYAAICEKPFGLPKKLHAPLPSMSNQLEGTPFTYYLSFGNLKEKPANITAATRWILSYRGECPLNRLKAMVSGVEPQQADDMRQSLINHLTMVVFLKHYPALIQLLQDLRYGVEIRALSDFEGLPVVILKAPLETFLPPDDFIVQVTQLSGIPAFQELIDINAVDNIPDPLRAYLKNSIS